ncbi:MAG: hypothetical protein PHE33_11295 [Bacteroidales bacterium]|nr:hypothetical protein [Bacteroidales bacterium]
MVTKKGFAFCFLLILCSFCLGQKTINYINYKNGVRIPENYNELNYSFNSNIGFVFEATDTITSFVFYEKVCDSIKSMIINTVSRYCQFQDFFKKAVCVDVYYLGDYFSNDFFTTKLFFIQGISQNKEITLRYIIFINSDKQKVISSAELASTVLFWDNKNKNYYRSGGDDKTIICRTNKFAAYFTGGVNNVTSKRAFIRYYIFDKIRNRPEKFKFLKKTGYIK